MALPPPSSTLLTEWIQPGALFTAVFALGAFFWKELKDQRAELKAELKELRAEQKAEMKELKTEFKEDVANLRADNADLKADNRVLNDKLDQLLKSALVNKS